MSRRRMEHRSRGFYAVGIYGNKTPANLGTLWRTATLYDAAFVFTVGKRYDHQPTDTTKTPRHIPLFHFANRADLLDHLPHGCPLVAVEQDPRARGLDTFTHPETACYLLGAEDNGLPSDLIARCPWVVEIETAQPWSMNVAVAGSMVLRDRFVKRQRRLAAAAS